MNQFITHMHKFKGARMAPSTNYDFQLIRSFINVIIKPYTGSTITTAVAGVKTADTQAGLGAATSNVGQTANNFYVKAMAWLRVTSGAPATSYAGTVLISMKDRIQPDNAVNYYVN